MAEPWDFTPSSVAGDSDVHSIFAGMGRVINEWSRIEISFSYLYAILIHRPRDGAAIRKYGAAAVFSHRVNNLAGAATTYFMRFPDQAREDHFESLLERARKFCDRRNEVAHGIVRRNIFYPVCKFTETSVLFALYPPYYDWRKHTDKGNPEYVYTSENLEKLAFALATFEDELDLFSDPMMPDEKS